MCSMLSDITLHVPEEREPDFIPQLTTEKHEVFSLCRMLWKFSSRKSKVNYIVAEITDCTKNKKLRKYI